MPTRTRSAHPYRATFRVALLLMLCGAAPATAQDRFGAAVAIDGDQVLVLKPGVGRGSAALYVFGPGGEGYQRVLRLGAADPAAGGEAMSPSLSVAGGLAITGSADAAGAWSGHLYAREGDHWTAISRVPLDAAASIGQEGQTLGMLMRVAAPPARLATLFDGGLGLAVVEQTSHAEGVVRLLRQTGGGWEHTGQVRLTEDAPRGEAAPPLAAPAVAGDWMAVGIPAADSTAQVLVLRRGPAGAWTEHARLDAPSGLRLFGMAVAFADDALLVGAPGSGMVIEYGRDGQDVWSESARIGSAEPAFGWSLAADGGALVVGAPFAGGSAGVVVTYTREGTAWVQGSRLAPADRAPGGRFGASVAVSGGRVAVGAPAADGGRGRVGVFGPSSRTGGPAFHGWLRPDPGVERVVSAEAPCTAGDAAGFACDNVDLLAFVPLADLGADENERVSDLWGWADAQTGREYALVGRTAGMAVIDVTDPVSPRMIGLMPGNPSGARDIKVYRDHAFMTGDGAGDHGLLVLDLTRVRSVHPDSLPVTFEPDARYDGISSAHNLVLNTESGFAYPVGASGGGETCGGGLHMVDVRDPTAPAFAGCYTDTEGLIWRGRTHDAQCIVYDGPDRRYLDREICFASNETALRIVDVTDKSAPEPISVARYPNIAYTHQGWLTDDRRYFYLNDEADELAGLTDRTRTLIWDVAELDDPLLVGEYFGPDAATDHNLYVVGDRMYQANYQAGLRVIDISDPLHPFEVGSFDTTPYLGNPPGFAGGAWTAYPFLPSGTVLVSSMNEGLFILRPRRLVP